MSASDDMPSLYQGVDKASVSYKLLSSMGWKEGEGLVSFSLSYIIFELLIVGNWIQEADNIPCLLAIVAGG
jgi:hypothetical protein